MIGKNKETRNSRRRGGEKGRMDRSGKGGAREEPEV